MDYLDIRQIEKEAASSYEHLARDFYNPALHPTTHVFGLAIEVYLRNQGHFLQPGGYYLEIGAGRSRIAEFAPVGARLVLADISLGMLLHSKDLTTQANLSMLVASAFDLPIRSESLNGVFALLGDAYGVESFFKESIRILKKGGLLNYVAPAASWGHTLRKLLGIPSDFTPLVDGKGRTLLVPSILTPDENLRVLLKSIGFSAVEVKTLYVPRLMNQVEIPKHISIVAQHEGVDPYDVPILSLIHAYKAD